MPAERARPIRFRPGGALLAIWIVLLAASWAVRLTRPPPALEGGPQVRSTRIPVVHGKPGETMRLVWRDVPRPAESPDSAVAGPDAALPANGDVFLLLHGSPGSRRDFDVLVPALARHGRVLVPDLPGFGDSERDIPDYSIRADALALEDWLDSLGDPRVHVIGFSMGGGPALHLADDRPDLVRSVTLLSSIGVQEFELLGDYGLNHVLHATQYATLRALRDFFPHFGALDHAFFGVEYARNFLDSDQRPLRGILSRLEMPLQILHGTEDFLVPFAAAREHERIVPQSELVPLEGSNHFILWTDTGEVVDRLVTFAARADDGEARTRAEAEPSRVLAADLPWEDVPREPARGEPLAILILLLVAGTFLSEDLTCVAAGLLVAEGRLPLSTAILACFLGIYLGDLFLFSLGRFARALLGRAPLRWIVSPRALDRARAWFERRGFVVILLSRFVPGTRLPTYVAAGATGASFPRFALLFLVAVGVWTPALVGFVSVAGRHALDLIEGGGRVSLGIAAATAVVLWMLLEVALPCLSWTGRRTWIGRLRRWTRWEFWPPWAFYPPVVVYILLLALRHRSLTLPTAVNPAMPEGGLIGESKADILEGLSGSPGRVARTVRLAAAAPPASRVESARAFVATHGLPFPVVLKPDVGERGDGVVIVRDAAALAHHAESAQEDLLLQEYVSGPEYGVFWTRHPGESKGRVFSVTEKILPHVTGDGRSTLEHLILADERAVCVTGVYFALHADRLETVPAVGERVPLAQLGTHCRGAIFKDGMHLVTPALERAIDEVSLRYEGFCFGRYDLRAADEAAFREGRDFKILELNGLTSEATAIYDERNSLFAAYRILFAQWRLAFEIAAQNKARGARPAPLRQILARVRTVARRKN